jgi:transglutaminase/protease-like cytokinesis protein 3
MEKEKVEEMRRGLDGKVEEILKEISEMTKEEKELYVHDYLVNTVSFAYVEESCMADTAYGALIDGKANCSGYSFAFMYLMRETGIPCIMCYGYANKGDHAWNIVQLEGEYRHVDVTWADWEEKGISHEYYNVTTEKISEDHEIIEVIYNYPNC